MQIKKTKFVAEEIEKRSDDGVRRLWLHVFLTMLTDLQNGINLANGRFYNAENRYKKMAYLEAIRAASWFRSSHEDVRLVCEYAGLDLRYVKRKVKPLLKEFEDYRKRRTSYKSAFSVMTDRAVV